MNTSHFVLENSMVEPWPDSTQVAIFGLGCFWGAERKFWQLEGVYTTAVGYSGGMVALLLPLPLSPNPPPLLLEEEVKIPDSSNM